MSPKTRFSRDDLLEALRTAAATVGPGPLRIAAYRAVHPDGPSPELIRTTFGSWFAACQAAGVSAQSRPSATGRTSDAALAATLTEYVRDCLMYDRPVRYTDYAEHCRAIGAPSGALLQARLREQGARFSEVVALIINEINTEDTP